jgi:hypothetical protein
MTLLSATDDLRLRTLDALGGVLERLAYVVGLRDEGGHYRHWGLSRIYGEKVANDAAAEVHSQVWLELLRTPMPKLQGELDDMEEGRRAEVVRKLKASAQLGSPANLEGGGLRHFNSVLAALDSLSKAKGGTHRAS